MTDRIETYSWNEEVYNSLLEAQEKGEYVGVGLYHFGTIINVEKKHDQDGEPYIEVMYQINH